MVSYSRVAVIGAGSAGLVAARELTKEGLEVVVFEKNDQVGGLWVYNPNTESDLLGLHPNRSVIHSSLYESLRTNLPRETMGFVDYPFVVREGDGRDPRRFPSHREVLMYLQDFAKEFRIEEMVRLNCEVISVEMVNENKKKWKVKSKNIHEIAEEDFDAVVNCNGRFTEPNIAEIPGVELWPGKQIHSHNYRTPEPFKDQVVVIIGTGSSAIDISTELAEVAKEIHIASRSVPDDTCEKQPEYDNIWRHSMIESSHENGTVVFRDGSIVHTDVILHCTGYKCHFPFLKINGIVTVDENRIGPLYKHIFPPALAPGLSFVGIPWRILVPFPFYDMQSKYIAGVLSGRIPLPSEEEMMKDVNDFYSKLEASNVPKRFTHNILVYQPEYFDWLSEICPCPKYEKWRVEMLNIINKNTKSRPKTYRDIWDDEDLIREAHKDFEKYI